MLTPLRFLITGAWNKPQAFALEFYAGLPEGSRMALHVPHWIGRGLFATRIQAKITKCDKSQAPISLESFEGGMRGQGPQPVIANSLRFNCDRHPAPFEAEESVAVESDETDDDILLTASAEYWREIDECRGSSAMAQPKDMGRSNCPLASKRAYEVR